MLKMVRNLWKISAEINVNGRFPLVMYQSKRSSLRVAIADVPGPMVKGNISFVTETNSNDGLPHTLEHLVFMGSERFPYKGVLDLIANRCLASGTNASTDQDNTSYTLDTVGSKGFIKVLPVFLDHLLSPNLTDSQYATEVHHINMEGEDAGVVYSEMQDHESEMESIVDLKRKELIYPQFCSYRVDTGGRLANLRTSCSNEKVRDYHKQYYHLKNLMITVCGKVNHDELLASIEPVEERELGKVPLTFDRPFQTVLPKISAERTARVVCPADDDTKGIVELAWLGPSPSELYKLSGLFVLFDYLTDTAVAPLQRDFVQVNDPYCSSVNIYLAEQSTCEIIMNFSGVPCNKLDKIKNRFFDKTYLDHKQTAIFDMERIGFIIDQLIKRYLTKMENNPSSQIFNALLGHQLYGNDTEELRIRLNEIETLKKLKTESVNFWQQLFQNLFSKYCVCVLGEPSTNAVTENTKKEEDRIAKQKAKFGKDGLTRLGKYIESCININTCDKPNDEVLKDLIVRDFEKFNTYDIQTNTALDLTPAFKSLPFQVVHQNTPSDFIDMMYLIDTQNVPVELRYFLLLWFQLIFQSPAIIDGKKMSFEDVSKLATRDLVSNSISTGINCVYDRFISLRLRVDIAGYENLPKWSEIYLKNIIFEANRIAICAKKLASAAAQSKRDGCNVSTFLSNSFAYKSDSNTNFLNFIALENFHKSIAEQVEQEGKEKIIEKLEELRRAILNCPINVHFVCDASKINIKGEKNAELWSFIKPVKDDLFNCLPNYGANWEHCGASNVIAVGGTESSFLLQKTQFSDDWNGKSLMEVLLLAQYITQSEGPLWNGVRGLGLVYGANIFVLPDRNSLTLSLYRCSQIAQAYQETKKVVLNVLESEKLDESQFEAAKRSLICELISNQSTVKSAAVNAILSTIRKINNSFVLDLCGRIWEANMSDVLKIGAPHIAKLFDDKSCIRSVAINPSKMSEVRKCFPDINVLKLQSLQIKEPKF